MEAFTLKRADLGDADTALAVCKTCRVIPHTHWTNEYPSREVLEQDAREGALYLLLENGKAIGIGVVMDHDDVCELPLPFAGKKPCVLARLGILPARQGRGLGGTLLGLLEQAAKARGFDSARLLCDEDNPITNRLYRHAGYAELGTASLYGGHYRIYEKQF